MSYIRKEDFPRKIGYEEKDLNRLISFTFSKDVVEILIGLTDRSLTSKSEDSSYQVYNIACEEQSNLKEILQMIESQLVDELNLPKSEQSLIKLTN